MFIHREETTGSTVFRRHIGNGGTVGHWHVFQAVPIELHKLAHHAFLAQHFRDGQHQVGRRDALPQLAGDLETDHLRNQHGDRLAKHGGFRFDTAHAPAEYAQTVDHGGVGIGAHQRVRVGDGFTVHLLLPHRFAQIFQIHLMADAGARRHHPEVVKGLLAPAQELVTFLVALHLDGDVFLEGRRIAELVHHHRVVDHQIHRR